MLIFLTMLLCVYSMKIIQLFSILHVQSYVNKVTWDEKRSCWVRSLLINLDDPKLQLFLICSVYNNNKLHPRLLLDMNNTISLLSVLTKNFHDARTLCNSLTYQFQCIGEHINIKGHFLQEFFEWKINTKY